METNHDSVVIEEPKEKIAEKISEEILEMPVGALMESVAVAQEMASGEEERIEQVELNDPDLLREIAEIPDRLAFKIGEVADILGVKSYVLRYWESEFEELKPRKSNHNQRMYTRNDVKTVLMIKKLLYRDRFSIEGARKALRRLRSEVKKETTRHVLTERYDKALERMHGLSADIQDLRQLFR